MASYSLHHSDGQMELLSCINLPKDDGKFALHSDIQMAAIYVTSFIRIHNFQVQVIV